MEIEFPIEFLVAGTPVSTQSRSSRSRDAWKERIRAASNQVIPRPHFASDERLSVAIYYFPRRPMQGDIDNIVKPILDALSSHVFLDDRQVERVVVQKFEPGHIFPFARPSEVLEMAIETTALYVRSSNDPFEDLT